MRNNEVITVRGKNPGKTSAIFCGVHGNEVCGMQAFESILPNLQIESGEVHFVYANPKAIELNVRKTDFDLNRSFKPDLTALQKASYEYGRAEELKVILNQCDALLDIHSSLVPLSQKFIICEPNAHAITKYQPIDILVSGFDLIEPGGTDYYMNKIGKIGICVECGTYLDPNGAQIAKESIMAFLAAQGHITKVLVEQKNQRKITVYTIYITQNPGFTLAKQFADFEELPKDTLIGTDGDQQIFADRDCVILFAQNGKDANEEGFLLAEYVP